MALPANWADPEPLSKAQRRRPAAGPSAPYAAAMAFSFLLADSVAWLEASRSGTVSPADAGRAAAQLRADYERWSRWWVGVGAFVLVVLATFVAFGMVDVIIEFGVAVTIVDIVIVVAASALGLGGLAVLMALWTTGRQLTSAAAYCLRLPYTETGRVRRFDGWVRARTVNFEPPIAARLTTSTLALLLAVGGLAVFVRDLVGDFLALSIAAGVIGLVGLACGLVQLGGVLRLVSGLAECDPLWHRIRGLLRGGR